MPKQQTKPVIILGMHRSGTSCLAGTLQQAGLYLGGVSKQNEYNKKGNREHNDIMSLNNLLLDFNKSRWDKPPTHLIWNDSHLRQAELLIAKLSQKSISGHWGFKDPRTLLTLPFWSKLLPNAIFIGTIRNPMDTALSLTRRNNQYTIEEGLQLWLNHNQILLSLLEQQCFPLISFDYPSKLYQQKVTELLIDVFPNASINELNFFDSSLRSKPSKEHKVPKHITSCYTSLQSYLF
jgi:hypothetical protein